MQPYGRLLYAVIGVTWAFHFTFTCWMIPKNQTDLSDQGTFFSLVVIYLMNLLLLSVMLILASRQITFESFGADLLTNLGNFTHVAIRSFSNSNTITVAVALPARRTPCEDGWQTQYEPVCLRPRFAQRSGYRFVTTANGSTANTSCQLHLPILSGNGLAREQIVRLLERRAFLVIESPYLAKPPQSAETRCAMKAAVRLPQSNCRRVAERN